MISYKNFYIYYLVGMDFDNIEKSEPYILVAQILNLSRPGDYLVYYPEQDKKQWLSVDFVSKKYSISINDVIHPTVSRIQNDYEWWKEPYSGIIAKIVDAAQDAYVRVEKMREK